MKNNSNFIPAPNSPIIIGEALLDQWEIDSNRDDIKYIIINDFKYPINEVPDIWNELKCLAGYLPGTPEHMISVEYDMINETVRYSKTWE